jgi:hypothetical protein
MDDQPPPNDTAKPDHGHKDPSRRQSPTRTISGRLFLAGTAVGCVILFFVVWWSIRTVEHQIQQSRTVLTWADRATWHAPAVISMTLVKPNAANVQYTYNKPRYRDPGFVISPQEEQAILACAKLAAAPTFTDAATRETLQQSADTQDNFYPHYLLALWHEQHNSTQSVNDHYQRAFDLAPKIIVIRYTDPAGKPVPNLKLDRIEIGCDRVTHEGTALNQHLVLIYPHQKTDVTGRVYLPVYDTTYRPVYLPQPEDYRITYKPNEGWFNLPTRLGTIQSQVITTPE